MYWFGYVHSLRSWCAVASSSTCARQPWNLLDLLERLTTVPEEPLKRGKGLLRTTKTLGILTWPMVQDFQDSPFA